MHALPSLLIANRGEIACRIIKTAKRLGIKTIAVYSDADEKALHVALADEAMYIGPAPAAESYLNIDAILNAARMSGARAIHPGYGFLSERAEFAEGCIKAGIIFVGPQPAAMRAMGAKDEAKRLMEKAGVPIVPGYHGDNQDAVFLRGQAAEIGYPVLIKATAGGGGKGMRRVDQPAAFLQSLASAQREAKNAFADERVLIEKYIQTPRHIEVQIFADNYGDCIHLFERDCSLQRRHQKVIEEAPAPGMTAMVRRVMGDAAIAAAKAVNYTGAGTIEFIADASEGLQADKFFFMEMNTRLQVEHPVTEEICGVDLVEWQLRIACGEKLPLRQNELSIHGHAIEARLYAEDPAREFLPSTGKIWRLTWPEKHDDIRIETGVREQDIVTPYYDPMIAKMVAHGATRDEAMERLAEALSATHIAGPKTNLVFLNRILQQDAFQQSQFDTGFIDKNIETLTKSQRPASYPQLALRALLQNDIQKTKFQGSQSWVSPWSVQDGFCLASASELSYKFEIDNEEINVTRDFSASVSGEDVQVIPADGGLYLIVKGEQAFVCWPGIERRLAGNDNQTGLKAPMNGKVTLVNVREGERVESGDRLVIIEAMKMEHAITAKQAGVIGKIFVQPGEQVTQGAILAEMVDLP